MFEDKNEVDDIDEKYDKRITTHGDIIHPDAMDDQYDDHYHTPSDQTISHLAYHSKVKVKDHDYEALKHNLEGTTQMFRNMYCMPLHKHFKSRFPAANVPRRNKAVATDTIYANTPAHKRGVCMAQIFVGRRTTVADVYPLNKQK